MDKQKLEQAIKLSNKVRDAEKKLEEAITHLERVSGLKDKFPCNIYIAYDYADFPEIQINDHELKVVLTLCVSRLGKELSEIRTEFKNL